MPREAVGIAVDRRHLTMLLVLAAIWGSAFMLIEIALRDLPPMSVVGGRIGLGALVLGLVVALRGELRPALAALRRHPGPLVFASAVNTAVPFFLIAWGQQSIDSGTSAILNSSAPIWTAVLAAVAVHSERVTGLRVVGILVGFVGVAVLVGGAAATGEGDVAGGLAVVAAAFLYAVGVLYVARRLQGISPLHLSLWTLVWSAALTVPIGAVQAAGADVGWPAAAAVAALGVGATAFAYILYFGLVRGAGPARAILVTYLVPATAIVYGVFLLGEPLTAAKVVGLALVLCGVALGTGSVRLRRASVER
jgi:drug/metabolite transporter (DMT)-like permease